MIFVNPYALEKGQIVAVHKALVPNWIDATLVMDSAQSACNLSDIEVVQMAMIHPRWENPWHVEKRLETIRNSPFGLDMMMYLANRLGIMKSSEIILRMNKDEQQHQTWLLHCAKWYKCLHQHIVTILETNLEINNQNNSTGKVSEWHLYVALAVDFPWETVSRLISHIDRRVRSLDINLGTKLILMTDLTQYAQTGEMMHLLVKHGAKLDPGTIDNDINGENNNYLHICVDNNNHGMLTYLLTYLLELDKDKVTVKGEVHYNALHGVLDALNTRKLTPLQAAAMQYGRGYVTDTEAVRTLARFSAIANHHVPLDTTEVSAITNHDLPLDHGGPPEPPPKRPRRLAWPEVHEESTSAFFKLLEALKTGDKHLKFSPLVVATMTTGNGVNGVHVSSGTFAEVCTGLGTSWKQNICEEWMKEGVAWISLISSQRTEEWRLFQLDITRMQASHIDGVRRDYIKHPTLTPPWNLLNVEFKTSPHSLDIRIRPWVEG